MVSVFKKTREIKRSVRSLDWYFSTSEAYKQFLETDLPNILDTLKLEEGEWVYDRRHQNMGLGILRYSIVICRETEE